MGRRPVVRVAESSPESHFAVDSSLGGENAPVAPNGSESGPFAGICLSCMALIAMCCLSALAASFETRFENGKLWVSAHTVGAPELFKAIAAKTGVRFRIDSELHPGPMTLEIEVSRLLEPKMA